DVLEKADGIVSERVEDSPMPALHARFNARSQTRHAFSYFLRSDPDRVGAGAHSEAHSNHFERNCRFHYVAHSRRVVFLVVLTRLRIVRTKPHQAYSRYDGRVLSQGQGNIRQLSHCDHNERLGGLSACTLNNEIDSLLAVERCTVDGPLNVMICAVGALQQFYPVCHAAQ